MLYGSDSFVTPIAGITAAIVVIIMGPLFARYVFPSLHRFSGPHAVGTHDLETGSLLIRMYYPTTNEEARSRQVTAWLPRYYYGVGLGDFIRVHPLIAWLAITPYLSLFYNHAYKDAAIAPLYSPEDALSGPRQPSKFPVIIFSHGLAGFRGMYSFLLGDMASRGFLVIAIEHRDGSACAATKTGLSPIWYNRPTVAGDELYNFRRKQLEERVNDVKDVMSLLRDFHQGTPVDDISTKNSMHWWSVSVGFKQDDLRNRIDFENVVMAGHSFGAATAITALQDPTFKFRCGVLLDAWCFAMKPSPAVTVPLLSCNSERFHWPENLQHLHGVLSNGESTYVTLKGTGHQDASDIPSMIPRRLLRYAGRSISEDPEKALRLQSIVILEFLRRNLQVSGLELPDYSTRLRDMKDKEVMFGVYNAHFKGLL
ncbi:1-alkyl-2-acetylglycerophosphocholine esterase [Synchytrium endobioticum]|uniref:Putative phospholipase n=1 Tax=Synchytrium endobioticum TaxID=286115 RepID=A0A507DD05_9FUNG|nr:1-alkyl-2-acetylglycerophosphocholine esterase [Synchytrium endobioticum]TPX48738.1 1-alkyl-2-acetylglycerophosphocholine esterase [Synchytrium endobioticum]